MYKILIVEDDKEIREMIEGYLTNEGFSIAIATNGIQAIDQFHKNKFDLILLDLMLPHIDGMTVMKKIREESLVPIIIVSAKGNEADKALGLGFGADDYMAKPFSLIELSARIKAHIRRTYAWPSNQEKKSQLMKVHDLEIDLDNFSVVKKGKVLKLTAKEFEILKLFLTNPNRVFTKGNIYEHVWEEAYYGDENVINVHIRRLREKIEDDSSNPIYIKTLWGIGYKMEAF